MFQLITSSLWDFRKSWRKYLLFSLFYLFLSSYILIPFLGYFLNRLILMVSSGVLLNSAAFSLLLDPRGVLGLIALSTLAVFFTVIQVGTLIILAHKRHLNKDILISDSILTAVASIKRMLGIGALYLALLFFLLIPVVNIPIMPELSELIALPQLLVDNFRGSGITRLIYFLMVGFFIYVLLRLIFTLHEVLIENQTVWRGMKSSFQLTKKMSFLILIKLLLFDIILVAMGTLFFAALTSVPLWLDISVNYIIRHYLVTLSGLLTYIYSLILIPLNIIFITKLYYQTKGETFSGDSIKYFSLKPLVRLEKRLFSLLNKRSILLPVMILFSIFATFFMSFAINQTTIYAGRDVSVISHRAIVDDEFENSLSAIRASIEADIDIIEFDVMLTADEVVVVHHDQSLYRSFGSPDMVNDLTYEEIQALDLNRPDQVPEEDPLVPTLEDVFQLTGDEVMLLIDVKTNGNEETFAEELVRLLDVYQMEEHAYVQSFSNLFLNHVHRLNPNILTSQIMYFQLGDLGRLEVDYYTAHQGMLSHSFVREARQNGKGVWVWTVNTEEDIKEVLQYDIDGIITNNPLLVKEILGRDVDQELVND